MLRPIDMSLTIQQAAEAHRAGQQGAQAARPEVASQMFADRLEKQLRQQEQQVVQSNQAEKADVHRDKEGDGRGYQARRKPAQKKPEPEKNKPKAVSESLYDIRV